MNFWHLQQTTRYLKTGSIIAYPTEAIYGLGCDPLNEEAVARLLTLKQRPWQKGLILIAADYAQLEIFLEPLTPTLQQRVFPTWPGPVTWLLPARPEVPFWLRGQSTQLAVRVTAHPQAMAVCTHWGGAIVSTSANRSGKPAAKTALQVRRIFGSQVDYIVSGQVGGRQRPSEIREALTNVVLRA